MSTKFIETFENLATKEKVAIWMHETPDPDAIGSAVGLCWLLKKKFDLQATIFYQGEISHPQNKTMLNVLQVNLQRGDTFDEKKYAKCIAVDSTENTVLKEDLTLDGIIDHHDTQPDETKYDFVIWEQVGSASTLIFKLIEECGVMFDKSDADSVVATAMLLGVKIDTYDLLSENTVDHDFRAYQTLLPFVDVKNISDILNYPLPHYLFELEGELLKEENVVQTNAGYIAFIGILSKARRDSLPILADKLLRMEGITTSVVFAISDGAIAASVRSSDASLDINMFCQAVFGEGRGGGKRGSGGAKVPLEFMNIDDVDDETKNKIADAVKSKVMFMLKKQLSGS